MLQMPVVFSCRRAEYSWHVRSLPMPVLLVWYGEVGVLSVCAAKSEAERERWQRRAVRSARRDRAEERQ